ncbi:hypothetical protein FPV67DRAFT_1669293 [Lyophyllum atratum]|nr:hypothetical protein FPV67DRAFT_1669293 [Lyophyllum atratum]
MVMLLRSGRTRVDLERRPCRYSPRPVVAPQAPARNHGAYAYVYGVNSRKRSLRQFEFCLGSTRALPLIHARFSIPATARPVIYTARLDMGPHSFFVMGWVSEQAPANLAIAALLGKIFKGEVALFSSGPRAPVLSRPRGASKEVVDRAATFFASRLEDAHSLGVPLNPYLRAPLQG